MSMNPCFCCNKYDRCVQYSKLCPKNVKKIVTCPCEPSRRQRDNTASVLPRFVQSTSLGPPSSSANPHPYQRPPIDPTPVSCTKRFCLPRTKNPDTSAVTKMQIRAIHSSPKSNPPFNQSTSFGNAAHESPSPARGIYVLLSLALCHQSLHQYSCMGRRIGVCVEGGTTHLNPPSHPGFHGGPDQ